MRASLIIGTATLFLLTACMAHNQGFVQNRYQQAINAEVIAWERAQAKTSEQCGQYDDQNPLPREKAMKAAQCYAEIVKAEVLPQAVNPIVVNDYLLEYEKISLDYKKGKIDRDEASILIGEAWNEYFKSIDSQYRADMQRAYSADLQAAQQRQQALQQLNRDLERQRVQQEMLDIQRTQAIIDAQQPNKTYHTNCYQYGNNINCSTR